MTKTMAEVLEELWDAGNCTGLDGWIGPGRGAIEVDDVALDDRRRDLEKALDALSAAGFGLVADAGAKALEDAADELPFMRRPVTRLVRAAAASAWLRARAAAVRTDDAHD